MFQDMKGAAFDVNEDDVDKIEEFYGKAHEHNRTDGYELSQAKELPELMESDRRGGRAGGRDRGGRYDRRDDRYDDRRGDRRDRSYGGDSNCLSVFVGGLSYSADEIDLEDFCKKAGLDFSRVKVLKDDTGRSKGVGFIDFQTSEDAQRAIGMSGHRICGRSVKIQPSNKR